MPQEARPTRTKRAPTSDKIREYILGDEQQQMTQNGAAKRLTPIEVIDRALDNEESRRIRAQAPRQKRDRL